MQRLGKAKHYSDLTWDYLARLHTSTMTFSGNIIYVETPMATVKNTNYNWLVQFMFAIRMSEEMQFVNFWPLHFIF